MTTTHTLRFYVLQTPAGFYATCQAPGVPGLTENFEQAYTWSSFVAASFVREAYEKHLAHSTGMPVSLTVVEVNRPLTAA
jgi:hypothetical protein